MDRVAEPSLYNLGQLGTNLVTPEQERAIWDSLLDADMSTRYWGHVARLHQKRDRYASIFLAITSSATVASWAIWQEVKWAWQALSVVAAIISVVRPLLNIERTIESMVQLQTKWASLRNSYERLWADLPEVSDEIVHATFEELKMKEVELVPIQARLPDLPKLLERSYEEVVASRGLKRSS